MTAIQDGWLAPIEQQMVTIAGLDFSTVRTTAGDLNGAELAAVMEQEENLQGLCAATLEIIGARQTIVFTSSVRHAELACQIFNRHRVGIAEWVCGATDRETRRKIMDGVQHGRTQILCNVGVATEGFDAPGVEVIIMGRPTKSRALYTQMAGRATRPAPGTVDGPADAAARRAAIAQSVKPACLLVDFVGNSGRHKLMTALDILGGKESSEVRALAEAKLRETGGPRRVSAALDEAAEEVREQQRKEAERRRALDEARKRHLVARATFRTRPVNPFDAFDIAPVLEGADRSTRTGKTLSRRSAAQPPHQAWASIPDSHESAQWEKELIDELFRHWNLGLCTLKQSRRLEAVWLCHQRR